MQVAMELCTCENLVLICVNTTIIHLTCGFMLSSGQGTRRGVRPNVVPMG